MTTLFISDLHLSNERPDKLKLFFKLLSGPAQDAEALYILGDLFEVWLGDDDTTPPNLEILAALAAFSQTGRSLYVMRGNRDFLMGSKFERMTGCTLLPDLFVLDLYGEKTLLMHGDLLCALDSHYQAFRRQVRAPEWQRIFLAKPLAERAAIANQLRIESQRSMRQKDPAIIDADQQTVEEWMRAQDVFQLIHGHTHKPAIHTFPLEGRIARRIVLGDWYEQDYVLICDEHSQRLIRVEDLPLV